MTSVSPWFTSLPTIARSSKLCTQMLLEPTQFSSPAALAPLSPEISLKKCRGEITRIFCFNLPNDFLLHLVHGNNFHTGQWGPELPMPFHLSPFVSCPVHPRLLHWDHTHGVLFLSPLFFFLKKQLATVSDFPLYLSEIVIYYLCIIIVLLQMCTQSFFTSPGLCTFFFFLPQMIFLTFPFFT